jgi:hypothetical protein
MSRPKAHHFVTQSYLRQFSVGAGKQARINVYERGKMAPWTQHPNKVARRTNYYSVERPDGSYDDSIEEILADIEASAIPVITRLTLQQTQPSVEDRQILGLFIAFQEFRVPGMRRMIEEGYLKMMLKLMDVAAETPGYLERIVEKHPEPKGLSAGEFRESIRNGFQGYRLSVDPSQSLAAMVNIAPTVARWYARMRWVILRMPDGVSLYTSDNPVLKRTTNPDKSTFYGNALGLSNRFIEIWFPISKTTLLSIGHDVEKVQEHDRLLKTGRPEEAATVKQSIRPETYFGAVPIDVATQVNQMIAANCHQYLYSPTRSEEIVNCLRGPSLAPRWE